MSNYNKDMGIVDIRKAEGGYNYYGYAKWSNDGQWAIMREKTDQSEYRWYIGKTDYTTNFANRASLNYKARNAFSTINNY